MITLAGMTRAQKDALLKAIEPGQRYVLGCARCAYPCTSRARCKCCAVPPKLRAFANFNHDGTPGHYPICATDDLRASRG